MGDLSDSSEGEPETEVFIDTKKDYRSWIPAKDFCPGCNHCRSNNAGVHYIIRASGRRRRRALASGKDYKKKVIEDILPGLEKKAKMGRLRAAFADMETSGGSRRYLGDTEEEYIPDCVNRNYRTRVDVLHWLRICAVSHHLRFLRQYYNTHQSSYEAYMIQVAIKDPEFYNSEMTWLFTTNQEMHNRIMQATGLGQDFVEFIATFEADRTILPTCHELANDQLVEETLTDDVSIEMEKTFCIPYTTPQDLFWVWAKEGHSCEIACGWFQMITTEHAIPRSRATFEELKITHRWSPKYERYGKMKTPALFGGNPNVCKVIKDSGSYGAPERLDDGTCFWKSSYLNFEGDADKIASYIASNDRRRLCPCSDARDQEQKEGHVIQGRRRLMETGGREPIPEEIHEQLYQIHKQMENERKILMKQLTYGLLIVIIVFSLAGFAFAKMRNKSRVVEINNATVQTNKELI